MKTTYIYQKDSTLWAFEGPEEPKKYQKGDSLTYNEAAWMVYKERMSTALESALPVVNFEKVIGHTTSNGSVYIYGRLEELKPGENVALPGWWLEKVLQKRWWGTEWHDLPGQTEGREPDGIYRTVCRLVRSDPEKKHIILTFKSGSLWHGEYQVVNPEVIGCAIIEMKRTKFFYGPPENGKQKQLSDGDQITLPDGYGIELRYQDKPDKIMVTFITLPEKPDNSAHTHQDYAGDRIPLITTVEPSESQEEMWAEFEKEFVQKSIIRMGTKQIIAELSQKFTITRK